METGRLSATFELLSVIVTDMAGDDLRGRSKCQDCSLVLLVRQETVDEET